MLFSIGGKMDRSDWKSWLAGGIVVMVITSFIRDELIDHRINQARLAVMASIDHEEQAIRHAREKAEQDDQKVDEAFSHALQSSQDVIHSSENTMSKMHHTMGMDKGQ